MGEQLSGAGPSPKVGCARKSTRGPSRLGPRSAAKSPDRIGRSGEIRTPDPLLPKQVRYQAALRSARPSVRRDSAAMPHDVGRSCVPSNVPWDGIRRARVIAAMALAGKHSLPCGHVARIAAKWPSGYSCGPPRVHAKHGFAMTGPMGRSQVVRQRILIPPFPGSNPGAPANCLVDQG